MTKKQKRSLYQILAALALVAIIRLLPPLPIPEILLYLVPYLVVGWDVLRKAIKGVRNRQPFDECFLMAVATVGAFALGEVHRGLRRYHLLARSASCSRAWPLGKSRREHFPP